MTTNHHKQTSKADYGQDMPGIVISFSLLAIVLLGFSFWQYRHYSIFNSSLNLKVSIILASIALLFGIIALVAIWTSRVGKLKLRDTVLSNLNLKGSESVLDVGCGRGLLLIDVAKKIPRGKAVGADLWLGNLEYKNSPQKLLDNAKAEGVANRVEFVTADALALPFDDNSFDLVMTSLMMHHVRDTDKALNEMLRVLKPGGTIVIADINSRQFAPKLQLLGVSQVETTYATRLLFIPAYIVKGRKSKIYL